MKNKPVVIIGDGWAALGAAGFAVQAGLETVWISGSGSRVAAPLPSIEAGSGLLGGPAWKALASGFGIETGEFQSGSFLREFRNKAFREPAWVKAPTAGDRKSVLEETLWEPELGLVPVFEGRFDRPIQELDEQIRERLLTGERPGLRRVEGMPITAFEFEQGRVHAVVLGSGEKIETDRVIYADQWGQLAKIQGLPKPLSFSRRLHPVSLLQAVFWHEVPAGVGLSEAFFGPLHREAGENFDKNGWGYFSADGSRSTWTICLAGEEVEDNHAIAKKLRRLKSALDKMFVGDPWVPQGKADFMSNVKGEQVRFEEAVLYPDGKVHLEPVDLQGHQGLQFVTDGYGPSSALHQVSVCFGKIDALRAETQAEGVNPEATQAL